MNTAEQIANFYRRPLHDKTCNLKVTYDFNEMIQEAEQKGHVSYDADNDVTEFDFPDGSVLQLCGEIVNTYGSR